MNTSGLQHPTDQLCLNLKTLLWKALHQNGHRFVIVKNEKYNAEKKESHCVEDKKAQRDHTLLCWKGSRRRGRERVCKDPSPRGDHGHHAMVSCNFHYVWLYFTASPRRPPATVIDR